MQIIRNEVERDDWILRILANRMRQLGKMYPDAGYGGMFDQWLRNPECQAYNSFGNGSAMRVSSVAWLYNDIDAVRHAAKLSAEVTTTIQRELKAQKLLRVPSFWQEPDIARQK